jgi:hypothetical protein
LFCMFCLNYDHFHILFLYCWINIIWCIFFYFIFLSG